VGVFSRLISAGKFRGPEEALFQALQRRFAGLRSCRAASAAFREALLLLPNSTRHGVTRSGMHLPGFRKSSALLSLRPLAVHAGFRHEIRFDLAECAAIATTVFVFAEYAPGWTGAVRRGGMISRFAFDERVRDRLQQDLRIWHPPSGLATAEFWLLRVDRELAPDSWNGCVNAVYRVNDLPGMPAIAVSSAARTRLLESTGAGACAAGVTAVGDVAGDMQLQRRSMSILTRFTLGG